MACLDLLSWYLLTSEQPFLYSMYMTDMEKLLNKATHLIISESKDEDEKDMVTAIASSTDKDGFCKSLEEEIPALAEEGNTKQIGEIVRALQKSGATPNIRKILHYFAQSESERGKRLFQNADKDTLLVLFENIATAFRLANEMDLATLNQS